MRSLAATLLLAGATCATQAQHTVILHQDTSLYVFGTVTDYQTGDSLPGTGIIIQNWPRGQEQRRLHADEHGRYEFYLGRGDRFRVSYSRSDRVQKHVEIDAVSVPDSSWHGGMAMEINMTLFKPFPGSDDDLFNEAIGRSRYNPATNLLEWDLAYTERIRKRLGKYMEDLDEPRGGK
ncbi:MAG: hypothetical protein KBH07_12830 [Flavobacteriales bacterium]|nr:hypothetical protein [Flavobacteriales bacterium]MBP9078613.1 hypothetical protein [Flavobacteriales bacterium]